MATFLCTGTGDEPYVFTWYNVSSVNTLLGNVPGKVNLLESSRRLTILNLKTSDAGDYRCTVTNNEIVDSAKRDALATSTLHVQSKLFLSNPLPQALRRGNAFFLLDFPCPADYANAIFTKVCLVCC